MTARFAPADIGADISPLPENERRALTKLVDAARLMDGLFLRQVWAGNDALLQQLAHDVARPAAPPPAAETRLHYFLINKGPWSRLDHNKPFVPGAPAKPEGRTSIRRAQPKRRSRSGWTRCRTRRKLWPPASSRRSGEALTAHSRRCRTRSSIRGSWRKRRALLREAAQLTTQPTLKHVPDHTRRCFHLERLLRQRCGLDGARRVDRADHRPVRGLRGRVVQLQGGVRSVHHRSRRRPKRRSWSLQRRVAGLENALPIDPPLPQSQARFARANPRRQRRLRRWRRQPRRADGRLQPAQRRARVREKGTQARDAEERPGGQIRIVLLPIAKVALPAPQQKNVAVRCVLHAHPDARADARPRSAQHHGRRPRDDRPAGAERDLQRRSKRPRRMSQVSGRCKQLADQGKIDAAIARTMYTTFLASAFRSIRFGINEAHGRGIAIQMNSLPRCRGLHRRGRTAVRGQRGEDRRRHRRADARDHDAPGRG